MKKIFLGVGVLLLASVCAFAQIVQYPILQDKNYNLDTERGLFLEATKLIGSIPVATLFANINAAILEAEKRADGETDKWKLPREIGDTDVVLVFRSALEKVTREAYIEFSVTPGPESNFIIAKALRIIIDKKYNALNDTGNLPLYSEASFARTRLLYMPDGIARPKEFHIKPLQELYNQLSSEELKIQVVYAYLVAYGYLKTKKDSEVAKTELVNYLRGVVLGLGEGKTISV
ncbi:MAG: hypothetical protein NTW04_03155 [Elusimicrobia bacterium]|nr:hypothetical protein [Elusimicrobiota bacterium]